MRMTSTKSDSNTVDEESKCNISAFNEQNVTHSDKNEEFISAVTAQLSQHFNIDLTNKDVVLYKLPDAEINFKEICRTCMATTNIKYIFNNMYEGTLISNLLMEYTSVSVQENDMLPKHICDICVSELINCYQFKKKCFQTQCTLEEIIKYSNTRQGTSWNDNKIQTPLLVHNFEHIKFMTNDGNKEQEIAHTENFNEQEMNSNLNEILNGSNVKEESELTIQNNEEVSCDANLLPSDLIKSNLENEYIKDNKQCQHQLPLSCSKRSDVFETSEELKKHHKGAKHPIKRRKSACRICGKLYTRANMESHMRTHTREKPFICRICARPFSTKSTLNQHVMLHTGERPYTCHICGKGYIRAHSLNEHISTCIHKGIKPILCDVCGGGFSQAHSFYEHKCIPSSKIPFESDASCNRSFKCKYCGTAFNQSLEYRNHMHHHLFTTRKLKEFRCTKCEKVFVSKNILKTHMLIHGEKSYLCNECGKSFYYRGGLLSHMKVHTKEQPYSCSECGKRFSHTGGLRTHKLVHTGQRSYNCETCLKSFKQKIHLQYHLRTHSGEKPYKCSYCNKCFRLKGTLSIHIRTHTGETPYVCDVCGREFHRSCAMKKHRRRHDDVKIVDETARS